MAREFFKIKADKVRNESDWNLSKYVGEKELNLQCFNMRKKKYSHFTAKQMNLLDFQQKMQNRRWFELETATENLFCYVSVIEYNKVTLSIEELVGQTELKSLKGCHSVPLLFKGMDQLSEKNLRIDFKDEDPSIPIDGHLDSIPLFIELDVSNMKEGDTLDLTKNMLDDKTSFLDQLNNKTADGTPCMTIGVAVRK